MELRADFSLREFVASLSEPWTASPMPGVERRMLDRVGGEVARATSIVRYAPGSRFSSHVHDGGEEFLVMDGVFSDASGDFGSGCYVRNPPGSSHAPWSLDGAVIFVKLRQFHPDDTTRVVIDSATAHWSPGEAEGSRVLALHRFGSERVRLLRCSAGTRFDPETHAGGAEMLVLDGAISDERGRYRRGDWLRCPPGTTQTLASDEGCLVYLKTGHLPVVRA